MCIYVDDVERRHFLKLLGAAFDSHDVDCHAYCLMPNHYHLVITTNKPNVSHAIQRINSPYAEWWNDRHSRVGHVFQGRFGAQVVQDETYLLVVCRYIVLNPVRAHLVGTPEQWPWSSYRATAGLDGGPSFLDASGLRRWFGAADSESTQHRYREFVMNGAAARRLPHEAVLGDEAFVERFDRHRRAASDEVPKRDRRVPPLTHFFREALTERDRAACVVAARLAGYSHVEIARVLGVHRCTVMRMASTTSQSTSEKARVTDRQPVM